MAKVEIRLTKSAEREFDRLDRETLARFAEAIERLRENPARPRTGLDIRPLKGLNEMWRRRVGNDRGIYQRDAGTLTFTRFAHRAKVY